MAQQQAAFADTIVGLKKALARADDGKGLTGARYFLLEANDVVSVSDSDDSIKRQTNRGSKLKRKSKFVQEGRLNQANGPKVYRRVRFV